MPVKQNQSQSPRKRGTDAAPKAPLEAKINVAKRRLETSPLPLKWFKFFKWVVIAAHIIMGGISIITSLVSFFAAKNPEVQAALPANLLNLYSLYCIICVALAIADIVLAVFLFRKLSELTPGAYTLLKVYIIFVWVYNVASEALAEYFKAQMFPETYSSNVIGVVAISAIFAFVWVALNLVYFSKRRYLFYDEDPDEAPRVVYADRYCPYCGAELSENSSFCDKCGKNL